MPNRDARYLTLRRSLFRWHRIHRRQFPWRATKDPYSVLVGEILLQRTRGENSVAVYHEFTERWPDVAAFSGGSTEELRTIIRPLGLAKRADTLAALAAQLGLLGVVPANQADLIKLPGVGPYISHAVPIFSGGRNLPLVDWVIARVLRRYFGLSGTLRPNADRPLWSLAAELVRSGRARETWLGILDLASAFCRRTPRCESCPLAGSCAFALGVVAS